MKYQWLALFSMITAPFLTVAGSFADNGATDLPSVTVAPGKALAEVYVDGIVEAVNEATVSAQTSGRIKEILFDVNDFVPKGSVILRFRDKQQQADVRAAEAAVSEANALLKEASNEYERTKDIYGKKLVARAALDKAEAAFKTAEQKTKAARARLEQARENLENTVVRAPYDGIVKQRHVEVGELANVGTALISGFSLDKLRVSIHVPQTLLPHLGQDARARILPDRNADTGLDVERLTVYPYADPATHTFQVRLYFSSDQGGLYPGMYTRVAIATGEFESIAVAAAAVVYRSDVTGVYVTDDKGMISFRQVRAGKTVNGQTRILTGLSAGDKVILDPIRAGIRLKEQRHGG